MDVVERRFSTCTDSDFKPQMNDQGHYACLRCQKDLSFDKRRVRFCSDGCRSEYLKKFTWWPDLRLKCFERDKWLCKGCGKEVYDIDYHPHVNIEADCPDVPRGHSAECDHIIPIFLGGFDLDLDNLQTLCDVCHRKKSAEEAKERTKAKTLIRNGVQKTLIPTCG